MSQPQGARLSIALGVMPVLALRLDRQPVRLGRARDNDVVLALPEIADHHAILTATDQGITLRALDGESFLLNGKPATEATLALGDRVILGGYRLQLLPPDAIDPISSGLFAEPDSHHTSPMSTHPVASGGPVSRIVVSLGKDAGRTIPFDRPAMLVGRSPDCDFVLHDEAISWRHLTLERVTEGVRVRDLGSRNGTWLDDQRVESAVAVGGSSIRAGRTTLLLASDDAVMRESAGPPERAQSGFGELVGCSAAMLSVYDRLREAAGNKLTVLLLGETGTGKELAARTIHAAGARARGPYVPLNCAAVPRDLIESELFGHARGAFTGAAVDREGAFAAADGGTIFLDEIAEMPPELQPKLLRILEDGIVQRVGGGRRRSDFRVIAATNRDLAAERAARRFRDDLYFRLAVRQIRLPALADRLEDLPDLVHSFLDTAAQQTGIATAGQTRFDETAFAPLREHTWPGNVRELRNLVLAAVALKPAGVVDRAVVERLLAGAAERHDEPGPGAMTLEAIERQAIVNALRDSGGNRREAARRLGISESTLYEKIKRFGLGGRSGGT